MTIGRASGWAGQLGSGRGLRWLEPKFVWFAVKKSADEAIHRAGPYDLYLALPEALDEDGLLAPAECVSFEW